MVDQVGVTHHIELAGQHYLIRPNTYRKAPAPLFGSRFTTGDPDYNNLSMWQHWVQNCWVGGFGAETWRDDAMFDEGVGVDTTQHEVMMLSRDLGPTGGARTGTPNWDLDGTNSRREFVVFNEKLYLLSYGTGVAPARLYRFDGDGPTFWVLEKTFGGEVRSVCEFDGFLIFGDDGASISKMDTSHVFTTIAKPSGITAIPNTMKVYRGQLYVPFGRRIYRLKTDFTWDGSTAFHSAPGVDFFTKSEVHLGFLYFASKNGHIIRTDANNTFDIWDFEASTTVHALRSFDGRLFVSCTETLDGTTAQQAVLYQFTGAAITELKRWGEVGKDIYTGQLRVIGSRLYFGAGSMLGFGQDGFGIATYDPREDAYHIWSTHTTSTSPGTENINWTVDDVFFWKGYVYCSVRGFGVYRTKFTYRDADRLLATYDTTKSGGSPGSKNGGWYNSSDFDAGTPGLLKLFNAITIHVDLPTTDTSVHVEYSTDGGSTYTSLNTVTKTGAHRRYRKTLFFPDGGLRATRLKYRLTLRTTDTTRSPFLRSVVVRYLPLPEPGWRWDFSVVVSDEQELLDGTTQSLDAAGLATKIDAIENAFRLQELVHFKDVDGDEWTAGGGKGVLVMDMRKEFPHPGADAEGGKEAIIHVVLVEAVESYS